MSAADDFPIDHMGTLSDDRMIGELLLIRLELCLEVDRLRRQAAIGAWVEANEAPTVFNIHPFADGRNYRRAALAAGASVSEDAL